MTNAELVERVAQAIADEDGRFDASRQFATNAGVRIWHETAAEKTLSVVAAAVREMPGYNLDAAGMHAAKGGEFLDRERDLLPMLEARVAGEEMQG